MTVRQRTALTIGGAFVVAALGWFVAGRIVQAIGAGELDLPARVAGVFLALSLADATFARLAGH